MAVVPRKMLRAVANAALMRRGPGLPLHGYSVACVDACLLMYKCMHAKALTNPGACKWCAFSLHRWHNISSSLAESWSCHHHHHQHVCYASVQPVSPVAWQSPSAMFLLAAKSTTSNTTETVFCPQRSQHKLCSLTQYQQCRHCCLL